MEAVIINSYNKLTMVGGKRDNSKFSGMVTQAITAEETKVEMEAKFQAEKKAAEEARGMFRLFG